MTNEQIKQNALEYSQLRHYSEEELFHSIISPEEVIRLAFIAGAHSRDEEIEQLEDRIKVLDMNLVEQQLENQQIRNPWISVEERLPEEGQTVIVRLAFGAGNHATCNYSNGQFVWALCIETSNVNIQSRLKLPAITHWMPIPELGKGE